MARQLITISIPAELKKDLDQLTAEEGISRSDVLRESLRDYLFLRKFRKLRSSLVRKAEARGIFTDEDAFKLVS